MAGTTSAKTPVDICNGALIKAGANRIISSITGGDSSTEAVQCGQVYYDKVEEALGANDWSFARKRANLAQLNVTLPYTPFNSQLSIVYAYPSDYIKLWKKSSRWARVQLLGQYIISDTVNLGIQYTYKNYNVASYYPKFKVALTTLLAAELCFSMTNSTKKAQMLLEQYMEVDLPAAESEDAQQGDAPHAIADEWENARMAGSASLMGVSGQDVWYPID